MFPVRKNTEEILNKVHKEITEKLMDSTLASRFGTSVKENQGREYEKRIKAKYRQLEQQFLSIDKNADDGISVEELIEFLNKTSGAVLFQL